MMVGVRAPQRGKVRPGVERQERLNKGKKKG